LGIAHLYNSPIAFSHFIPSHSLPSFPIHSFPFRHLFTYSQSFPFHSLIHLPIHSPQSTTIPTTFIILLSYDKTPYFSPQTVLYPLLVYLYTFIYRKALRVVKWLLNIGFHIILHYVILITIAILPLLYLLHYVIYIVTVDL